MDTMVTVSQGEVWADDSGGDGLPLVLLHPGVGDSAVWDPVLPALVARHRVIRYDVRGYGRSPAPTATYSTVRDLSEVLDHFAVERAVLVGSSMGGATSVDMALESPDAAGTGARRPPDRGAVRRGGLSRRGPGLAE
ncbi:alpha/beta fold hydrolase [Streptomyces gardneri]|uniref:alpha/beta fold hydrolase n=1 Tax=Streptomyces gardneri TaxID=66892 RepID=UPI0036C4CAAA